MQIKETKKIEQIGIDMAINEAAKYFFDHIDFDDRGDWREEMIRDKRKVKDRLHEDAQAIFEFALSGVSMNHAAEMFHFIVFVRKYCGLDDEYRNQIIAMAYMVKLYEKIDSEIYSFVDQKLGEAKADETVASDEEVFVSSQKFLEKNKEAYEVLGNA